jgi:co-chaperonin GroES (HSP10)
MNCKIKPLSHRIIVEERPAEMKVKSIVMPNSIKSESQQAIPEGKIICVAENAFDYLEKEERPQVGDIVHFIKYDGIGKNYNKKYYRILMDESIWGTSDKYIGLDEELVDG